MKLFNILFYKFLVMLKCINLEFARTRLQTIKDENDKLKTALGNHDFPISNKSTQYPE